MNTEKQTHTCSGKGTGACKCAQSCRCGDNCTCGERCQCATTRK